VKLTVIVIAFGKEGLVRECVSSLVAALERVDGESEVFVVVNDGEVELPPGAAITTLPGDRELGFAGAVALGLERARGAWIALVNDDCTVDPDSLAELVRNLENPTYPFKSVVVSFNAGSGAVSFRGHVARNLPPGAIDAIRPTTSSVAPDSFQSDERVVLPLGDYMVGRDRVSVQVRKVLR